jgi:hypothetical protein
LYVEYEKDIESAVENGNVFVGVVTAMVHCLFALVSSRRSYFGQVKELLVRLVRKETVPNRPASHLRMIRRVCKNALCAFIRFVVYIYLLFY